MSLKDLLKLLKLNESTISMALGALIVIVVGFSVINIFRSRNNQSLTTPANTQETPTNQDQTETKENIEGKIPSQLPQTYKVQKGDNLWRIAEHYFQSGYNWVDIAKENKLTNPGKLAVGQEISIPKVTAKKTTTETVSIAQTVFGPPIHTSTYTVAKGDHLWGIAVRAYGDGYQWVNIAKENKISHPNYIEVGQVLKVPQNQQSKGTSQPDSENSPSPSPSPTS